MHKWFEIIIYNKQSWWCHITCFSVYSQYIFHLQLREQLLSNICVALTNSSFIQQDRDVLMVANAVLNLVELDDEVNSGAQVVKRPNTSSNVLSNSSAP